MNTIQLEALASSVSDVPEFGGYGNISSKENAKGFTLLPLPLRRALSP